MLFKLFLILIPINTFSNNLDFNLNYYNDFYYSRNAELLNNYCFDNYNFFQTILDANFLFKSIDLINIYLQPRARTVWGDNGFLNHTVNTPLKIGIGKTENSFEFKLDKFLIIIRQLYLETYFDFKKLIIGFFPKSLGLGLILGNGYKVEEIIPGNWQEKYINQYRPAINFSSTSNNECWNIDFYISFPYNFNKNFFENGSLIQSQVFNRSNSYLSNELIILAQISYNYKNIRINPFIIFNYDKYQKIEFKNDAHSKLGISGLEINYSDNKVQFYLASAINFGHQKVKSLDRNNILMVTDQQQMHLFEWIKFKEKQVWSVSSNQTIPEDLSVNKEAGEIFKDESGSIFKNSFNRFRKEYYNKYYGWTIFTKFNLKIKDNEINLIGGIASGDDNPNDSSEKILANRFNPDTSIYNDYSKKYKGFIGIESLYNYNLPWSFFILEAQKLNRPLSSNEIKLTYPEFTNLIFCGTGFRLNLESLCNYNLYLNWFLFFQQKATIKNYNYSLSNLFSFNSDLEKTTLDDLKKIEDDSKIKTKRFLANEINCTLSSEVKNNLFFNFNLALFIPGLFYKSVKEKYINLDSQFKLSQNDNTGIELTEDKYNFKLGNKNLIYLNLDLTYNY